MNNASFGVILLSGGTGRRMNSDVPKQYMDLAGKPVLYYSLKAFEDNKSVNEIVLVVSHDDIPKVRENIINKYNIKKVSRIVDGGKERFNSVYNGLRAMGSNDYVMIHDGARPCISCELITRLQESVITEKACIPAVPSKDTVKIADNNEYVISTPARSNVWNVQTPQTFELTGLRNAFKQYMADLDVMVTDDSMIWERYSDSPVKIIMGEYNNVKITTPEDMVIAERNIKPLIQQ